jgi:hypothetical protein
LDKTWAGPFQRKVLPLLFAAEDKFAALYCDDNGRPNWSIAHRLGILLLQELLDLTDQEVLDSVTFDVRLQYALDLAPAAAYLSRRSLDDFRSRLVAQDPEMTLMRLLFDEVAAAAIADLRVSFSSQRLDSTQIVSNIRCRGRIDLFAKTLRHFLRELHNTAPERMTDLPAPLAEWYAQSEATGDFGRGKAARTLQTLAEWAVAAVRKFEADEDICSWESWELVRRIVREHCTVVPPDGSGPPGPASHEPVVVQVLDKAVDPGTSLQSPHDPDATCGHKGVGYCVQIAETTGNALTEILTDYEVRPAATNDWGQTTPVIDRLEAAGRKPDTATTDAGYVHGKALLEAEERGVTLHSPVHPGGHPKDVVGREAFAFDDDGTLLACPTGHKPLRFGHIKRGNSEAQLHAYFDGNVCRTCPLVSRCVARGGKDKNFVVELRRELLLRDLAIHRQRTDPTWWTAYRVRAGIEATNSELKRRHGLGRLRVRRMPRVRFKVAMKLTACNAKRWMKAAMAA